MAEKIAFTVIYDSDTGEAHVEESPVFKRASPLLRADVIGDARAAFEDLYNSAVETFTAVLHKESAV